MYRALALVKPPLPTHAQIAADIQAVAAALGFTFMRGKTVYTAAGKPGLPLF